MPGRHAQQIEEQGEHEFQWRVPSQRWSQITQIMRAWRQVFEIQLAEKIANPELKQHQRQEELRIQRFQARSTGSEEVPKRQSVHKPDDFESAAEATENHL